MYLFGVPFLRLYRVTVSTPRDDPEFFGEVLPSLGDNVDFDGVTLFLVLDRQLDLLGVSLFSSSDVFFG